MFLVNFFQGVEHSGSCLAMLVSQVQEINNLADGGVLNDNHVLGQIFKQS